MVARYAYPIRYVSDTIRRIGYFGLVTSIQYGPYRIVPVHISYGTHDMRYSAKLAYMGFVHLENKMNT